jgi:hypothetical protein
MIDFKKLDRVDLWIASDSLTPEQEKAFSEFLKTRKAKEEDRKKPLRSIPQVRKNTKVAAK